MATKRPLVNVAGEVKELPSGDTLTIDGTPLDVMGFYPGLPTASAILTRVPIARAVVFPASLAGSYGKASANATAQTDFDVQKNGSSFGTMRFAAAASTATFISASGSTFAAGDVLSVVAPATPDATLANVGFAITGTR